MAKRKKVADEEAVVEEATKPASKFDWGKVSAVAVAITAISGAIVAVSKDVRELVLGEAKQEAAANSSAPSAAQGNSVAVQSKHQAAPDSETANGSVRIAINGEEVRAEGNLRNNVRIRTRRGTDIIICGIGQTYSDRGCGEPASMSTCWDGSVIPVTATCPPRPGPPESCPPGWTPDASGGCVAAVPPDPIPELKECPGGSVIPIAENCPEIDQPSETRICPNGRRVPVDMACPQSRPGPFIVFFDFDKDEVGPEAAAILDNAAEAYRTTGQTNVMLAGYADRSGSDTYNISLSQRRANSVRSYLANRGVPDRFIMTAALGEANLSVATCDGVREPQNRRVEVIFGTGGGTAIISPPPPC